MLPLLLALATFVAAENQRPGNADWEISAPAPHQEIEGYASRTSVNGGEPIDLLVNTGAARYSIEVYRMGWYAGAGARRVAGPIVRTGIAQAIPRPDATTGLVECDWRDPYALETRDQSGPWPSGIYLARLTTIADRSGPAMQSYIVFVVRDDGRRSDLLFQSSVTTFAGYNNWGGRSLYAFNSGNAPARKVSFDRPYATNPYGVRLDGAGDFLRPLGVQRGPVSGAPRLRCHLYNRRRYAPAADCRCECDDSAGASRVPLDRSRRILVGLDARPRGVRPRSRRSPRLSRR